MTTDNWDGDNSKIPVRNDLQTNDVNDPAHLSSWDGFFELLSRTNVPANFLVDLGDVVPQVRVLFG